MRTEVVQNTNFSKLKTSKFKQLIRFSETTQIFFKEALNIWFENTSFRIFLYDTINFEYRHSLKYNSTS